MTDSIAHRGPDGEGHYCSGAVLLGSRRLAILDVEGGKQPMFNNDGSVVVVFNGEIYNFLQIRKELIRDGYPIRTGCDTEIIPYLYDREGPLFVKRLNGIFSIALWDNNKKELYLYRDPIGVKPLVYARKGSCVAFGSEAKAILTSGLVSAEPDPTALHYSMNVRYIPGTRTLFRGISRLKPGHYLAVSSKGVIERPYEVLDASRTDQQSPEQWMEGIRHHIGKAVNRQLVSDVPVGFTLSGGVDSSTIVAMASESGFSEVQTYTLGFNEPWDENEDARFVANFFSTNHSELILDKFALSKYRESIYFAEEPKVNCLQLYLLYRYVGKHVKVALSGLGSDELFGGYDFYNYLFRAKTVFKYLPSIVQTSLLSPICNSLGGSLSKLARPYLDLYVRELDWLASSQNGLRQYLLLRNAWDFNKQLLQRVYHPEFREEIEKSVCSEFEQYFDEGDVIVSAAHAEFNTKLVNDLLHNEDAMSMAHSVESRVPWLDLEFVRFANKIPSNIRLVPGNKTFLKKSLRGIIPDEVIGKRKRGFSFDPVKQLTNGLRSQIEKNLLSPQFNNRRIFNLDFIESVLSARPHQRLRWHYFLLWQMIGFEHWCGLFLDNDKSDLS